MPSDDSFQVMIANLTPNAMNPLSWTFEWGGFASNGYPVTVPANTTTAEQAFKVQGKVGAGPQGTVNYNIDSLVQAVFQYNSNVGGNEPGAEGDYFYAGLQPQAAGGSRRSRRWDGSSGSAGIAGHHGPSDAEAARYSGSLSRLLRPPIRPWRNSSTKTTNTPPSMTGTRPRVSAR
jgi:hypothetical protein